MQTQINTKMLPKLNIDRDKLTDFCRGWHIRRLWLFGSVLRDEFRDDSDVDVLYEFAEGKTPGWEIVDVGEELSSLLGGRKVDFVPMKYLSRRIKNHAYFNPELLFDEG